MPEITRQEYRTLKLKADAADDMRAALEELRDTTLSGSPCECHTSPLAVIAEAKRVILAQREHIEMVNALVMEDGE